MTRSDGPVPVRRLLHHGVDDRLRADDRDDRHRRADLPALEQSRADLAIANLRAIYSAERYYCLETQSYAAGTLDQLSASPRYLRRPDFASQSPYTYDVTPTGPSTFTATATRTGSASWTGGFSIDQNGAVTGSLTPTTGNAATIYPPSQ